MFYDDVFFKIEGLASTWLERQKVGGEYSVRTASRNKHVIVCSTSLTQETVMDFLNEFYAHPKLEVTNSMHFDCLHFVFYYFLGWLLYIH